MRIAVLREDPAEEPRVAATPETVKKLVGAGHAVTVEAGAGRASAFPDEDYAAAGAEIALDARAALFNADLVLKVRRPDPAMLGLFPRGAAVVALMDPYGQEAGLRAMA